MLRPLKKAKMLHPEQAHLRIVLAAACPLPAPVSSARPVLSPPRECAALAALSVVDEGPSGDPHQDQVAWPLASFVLWVLNVYSCLKNLYDRAHDLVPW